MLLKKENSMKILSKIKSLLRKRVEERVEIVDRGEFAQEMKDDFKGNTELLKAIEKCMNRNVKPNQRVSLTN
jgi:enolase